MYSVYRSLKVEETGWSDLDIYYAVFLFIVGLVMIIKGGDIFIDSAVVIAYILGVSKMIIGATLVSLGTTLPEIATSVNASFRGESQFALGNAIGSIDFNTGLVLGILIIISGVRKVDKDFKMRGKMLLLLMFFLYIFSLTGGIIGRLEGLVLLIAFFFYSWFSYGNYKRERKFTEKNVEKSRLSKSLFFLSMGALLVVKGADFLVTNGILIADFLGVPSYLISLTIVAFGTSLPELVTAVAALVKKHHDLSVGNILGANIMNIGLAVSFSALISPIEVTGTILRFDLVITAVFVLISILFGLYYSGFRRYSGVVLLAVYVFYVSCLIMGLDDFRFVLPRFFSG
ncbi:MAG: calcium/sodium antiporter [Halanaerobiaceae bacterium]